MTHTPEHHVETPQATLVNPNQTFWEDQLQNQSKYNTQLF
jgi:hypothetical protein